MRGSDSAAGVRIHASFRPLHRVAAGSLRAVYKSDLSSPSAISRFADNFVDFCVGSVAMAMVGRPARAAAHAVSFYIELDGPERAEPSGRPVSHTQLMCIHAIQHTIHTLTSGLAANSAQAG